MRAGVGKFFEKNKLGGAYSGPKSRTAKAKNHNVSCMGVAGGKKVGA